MPDKDIMLQIKNLSDRLGWRTLDALRSDPYDQPPGPDELRAALEQLSGDYRMLADLYDKAKLKGAKTVYIEPLRHAAGQLDKVIATLAQPRPVAPGELRPTSAPPAADAGLDEPRHRFEVGPGATGSTCTAMVERNGAGDQCGRYPSHSVHRLDGPTERPGLDALIAEAAGRVTVELGGAEVDVTEHVVNDSLPSFPGQASGDEVTAYLRGEVDDIPGVPPHAQVGAHDMTIDLSVGPDYTGGVFTETVQAYRTAAEILESASMTTPAQPPAPGVPPVPLLGQPGDIGSGYSPAYVPPGGVPATFAELLTLVPPADLPPHLSHSQIGTVGECPTKYRLTRLPRQGVAQSFSLYEIPQWARIGGGAFHAAVEAFERFMAPGNVAAGLVIHRDPIGAGPDVVPGPWDMDCDATWRHFFEAEIQKIEASQPVPRSRWRASKKGAEGETWWSVNGPEMLRRYLAARPDEPTATLPTTGVTIDRATGDSSTTMTPAIEIERTVDVSTNYGPVAYKVIIDRITVRHDPRPGGSITLVIRDYKTGATMPGDTSQLGEYAQVLRLLGVPPQVKIVGTFFDARKGTWTPEVDLDAAWPADWFVYHVTTGQAQRLALTQGPTPARPSSFCGGCAVRWACPIKGVQR